MTRIKPLVWEEVDIALSYARIPFGVIDVYQTLGGWVASIKGSVVGTFDGEQLSRERAEAEYQRVMREFVE